MQFYKVKIIKKQKQQDNNQKKLRSNMQEDKNIQLVKSISIPKSSLQVIGVQNGRNIEYLNQQNQQDKPLEISDEQKEEEMNKMREQYIVEKLNRKKQLMKIKKEEFGSSSSEDDDVGVGESVSDHSDQIRQEVQQDLRKYSEHQDLKERQSSDPLSKPHQVYILKGKDNWNQTTFSLSQKTLSINPQNYELSKITKLKSIPIIVSKNLLKIKISYNAQQIMIAAPKQLTNLKKQKLPVHYAVFASIITKKLSQMGLKFYQLDKSVPGVPQSIIKNSLIYGKIFKKSQILGRWQQRLIVINQMGLYSYKRFNEQHSMFIAASSVTQMWTRFQIVDQNLLVIKILHSSNTKTQFGIPITDFMTQKNWLYQFYLMGLSQ